MSTITKRCLDAQRLENALCLRAESDLETNTICGASVIVRQEGNIVCERYFGTTAPYGTEKVAKNTIYRLASMTKPITAVAALILADRGMLRLDAKVEEYLPQYKNRRVGVFGQNGVIVGTKKAQVAPTIRHILSHSSGISCGENERNNIRPKLSKEDRVTVKNMMSAISHSVLSFEPFEAQEYSAVGAFAVLTAIIEEISGMNFETFLQKEVFSPCAMQDTTFEPSAEQMSRLIAMHSRVSGKSIVGETEEGCIFANFPCTNHLGGAGLVSTLHDYSNFAEMLLNEGSINGQQILSTKAICEMSTAQVPEGIMPGKQRWGLGVRVITGACETLPTGAYGWSGAYGTHFWVDPINKITAVYMKNSLYDGGAEAVTARHFEEDVAKSLI